MAFFVGRHSSGAVMCVSQMSVTLIYVSPEQHLCELGPSLGATMGDISFQAEGLRGYFIVSPEKRRRGKKVLLCAFLSNLSKRPNASKTEINISNKVP